MTLDVKNPISLDALDDVLRNAQEPCLDLLSKIIAGACTLIPKADVVRLRDAVDPCCVAPGRRASRV